MKKSIYVLALLLSLIAAIPCFAQGIDRPDPEDYDWRMMLLAQRAYERSEYGDALAYAQKAKDIRRRVNEWELNTLQTALTPAEVRREGNAVLDVLPVLRERETLEAVKIIEELIAKKSYEFFHGSIKNIIDYMKSSDVYPEADFLIGKIYQMEGEYELAKKFYTDAWLCREFLDIPDVRYDILYQSADLAKFQGNYDEYEKFLVTIISEDSFYKNDSLKRSMLRTIASKDNKTKIGANNVERFFTMYRAYNIKCIPAYFQLAGYYAERNNNDKALLSVALGSLTVFTRMYDMIKKESIEYEYTDFITFLEKDLTARPDVADWAVEQTFWDGLLLFADIAVKNGCSKFANELLPIIGKTAPQTYWRSAASHKIELLSGITQN